MLKSLFGNKYKKKEEKDPIILCAEYIIENGELLKDDSQRRLIPSVEFGDDKGNTLYVSWYHGSGNLDNLKINSKPVPIKYDQQIFKMAKQRIQFLQEKNLREIVESVRK